MKLNVDKEGRIANVMYTLFMFFIMYYYIKNDNSLWH